MAQTIKAAAIAILASLMPSTTATLRYILERADEINADGFSDENANAILTEALKLRTVDSAAIAKARAFVKLIDGKSDDVALGLLDEKSHETLLKESQLDTIKESLTKIGKASANGSGEGQESSEATMIRDFCKETGMPLKSAKGRISAESKRFFAAFCTSGKAECTHGADCKHSEGKAYWTTLDADKIKETAMLTGHSGRVVLN